MITMFRMLKLAFWHDALNKIPKGKIKQRVKLKNIGIMPTPNNPIIGSVMECEGTIVKIIHNKYSLNKVKVRWDNGTYNVYYLENLMVSSFPLRYIPKLITIDSNNPNITFKELSNYKINDHLEDEDALFRPNVHKT